jgi:hypothetical protein
MTDPEELQAMRNDLFEASRKRGEVYLDRPQSHPLLRGRSPDGYKVEVVKRQGRYR